MKLAALLFVGLTPFHSLAQETAHTFTARALTDGCKELLRMEAGEFPPPSYEAGQIAAASLNAGACVGFINGFLSGYGYAFGRANTPTVTRKICVPAGVTRGQIARVLVARLQEKPEFEHLPADAYMPAILQLTWPCSIPPQ